MLLQEVGILSQHWRLGAPTLVLVGALALAPAARAEDSVAYEGVLGVGSAVCTLVYSPVKVVYAAGGLVISSLALLWTWDPKVAEPIYAASLGGDYVVTPSHLEGTDSLEFTGRW
jgi:hypothetical protein